MGKRRPSVGKRCPFRENPLPTNLSGDRVWSEPGGALRPRTYPDHCLGCENRGGPKVKPSKPLKQETELVLSPRKGSGICLHFPTWKLLLAYSSWKLNWVGGTHPGPRKLGRWAGFAGEGRMRGGRCTASASGTGVGLTFSWRMCLRSRSSL